MVRTRGELRFGGQSWIADPRSHLTPGRLSRPGDDVMRRSAREAGYTYPDPRDGSGGVFAWSAIDGEATWVADTLSGFWAAWLAGSLPPR